MATVSEIHSYLDTLLPRSLSCEWDNDGLMVTGDKNAEVKKILFTLDITMQAVEYAEKIGADLIISHHPLCKRRMTFFEVISSPVMCLMPLKISG